MDSFAVQFALFILEHPMLAFTLISLVVVLLVFAIGDGVRLLLWRYFR